MIPTRPDCITEELADSIRDFVNNMTVADSDGVYVRYSFRATSLNLCRNFGITQNQALYALKLCTLTTNVPNNSNLFVIKKEIPNDIQTDG